MKLNWMLLGMLLSGSSWLQAGTNFSVQATADNVNLRVRPDSGTEVVGQAHKGQSLDVVRVEGDWMGVLAPTNVRVWVKSQFVRKGVVVADKIRLRAGPGISYRDVGLLNKDVPVIECESHGEWTRINPPEDLVVWVSAGMVTSVTVVVTAPVPAGRGSVPAEQPAGETLTADVDLPRDLPAGLSQDQLSVVPGQGAMVSRSGTVEQLPLAFLRDIQYRLVETQGGRKVTICFLQGNDRQMPSLVGRRLTVKGREYWLKSQHCSVVYPELITPVLE